MSGEYAGLLDDLTAWPARSDVTSDIATLCITLAESYIFRRLKTFDQEVDADIVCSSPTYAGTLPTTWLAFRRVYSTSFSNPRCKYVSPDVFHTLNVLPQTSLVTLLDDAELFYTVESGVIKVHAPTGTTGSITLKTSYWRRYKFNGDFANDTNPIIQNHYDLYLNACLRELWDFFDESEMVQKYENRTEKILAEIEMFENRRRVGAVPLRRSSSRTVIT